MRWKYIVPRIVLVALVWAFFAFGFDPLLHRGLITAGQNAIGAKVDLASFETKFFPPSVSMRQALLANRDRPGTNLLEFDSASLRLEGAALLKKSYIIDEGTISGVRWGTPRADSGLLAETPAEKKSREVAAKASAERMEKLKAEVLARGQEYLAGLGDRAKLELDPDQFESVRLGEEIEERWTAKFQEYDARAQELKKQIETIKAHIKSKEGNTLDRIEAYRTATAEAARLTQELKRLRGEIDGLTRQARQDLSDLDQAKQRDLTKIREKVDMFRLDPQELSEFLLGPELHHRLNQIIDWTRWTKARLVAATDDPQPERWRGRDFTFPRREELPKFLVKLIKVSGDTELLGQPQEFAGTVSGVTSHPEIHGQPVIVRLKSEGAVDANVKAVFDYTNTDVDPSHEVLLSYRANDGESTDLGDPDSLAIRVTAGQVAYRAELKLVGEAINGKLHLRQTPVKLAVRLGGESSKIDQRVAQVFADIVGGIEEFEADLDLTGTLGDPQWSIESNLGPKIAEGVNKALVKQLEQGREALLAKLDQAVAKQTDKLHTLFDEKAQLLTARLHFNDQEVKQLVQQVAGGRLPDLNKIATKPLDVLKKPLDPNKPLNVDELKKQEESLEDDLKKVFRR
jgi:uncharacterized protein (TIGR03545 family)